MGASGVVVAEDVVAEDAVAEVVVAEVVFAVVEVLAELDKLLIEFLVLMLMEEVAILLLKLILHKDGRQEQIELINGLI